MVSDGTCRHCGGQIHYVETVDVLAGEAVTAGWWIHLPPKPPDAHAAAPAFEGGSS